MITLPGSDSEAAAAYSGLMTRLRAVVEPHGVYLVEDDCWPSRVQVGSSARLCKPGETPVEEVFVFSDWGVYMCLSTHPAPESYAPYIQDHLAGWLCDVLLNEEAICAALRAYAKTREDGGRYESQAGLARKALGADWPTWRCPLVAEIRDGKLVSTEQKAA